MPTPHRHGRLFVLDGNNIAYRAFFALPESIATSSGFPTNALYGFCAMMIKILSDYRPDGVIVAWDSREKTFRHEEFEAYKAQRKPMPDLLVEQWPYFVELAEAFGFVNLAAPGFEADDIIATLARQADAEGREFVIVTGDRDALQLVTEHVSVMSNTRGVTEVKMYDPAAVVERFGVLPRLIPDLIGLKGDTSDNIPGIPGIGEKTAAQLLAEFGSLEEVLAGVDRVKGPKRQRAPARASPRPLGSRNGWPYSTATLPSRSTTPRWRLTRSTAARLRELFDAVRVRLPLGSARGSAAGGRGSRVGVGACGRGRAAGAGTRCAGTRSRRGLVAARGSRRAHRRRARQGLARPGAGRSRSDRRERGRRRHPVGVRAERSQAAGGPLRELLRRGAALLPRPQAGDRAARGCSSRAGHDTYLAAYLLAPGPPRRTTSSSWRRRRVCRPCGAEGPHAGAAEAATVVALAPVQERLLRELGMWSLFEDIELPLTRVLIDMEGAGIHLDCYRLGEITAKIQDQMDGLEAGIYELAEGEFNLGSPQQLGQVLFERLGLPRQGKTKKGSYSTDAKTLEALRASHPIIERIETHRELSKLLSTYLLALPAAVDPATGRLHTTFHQAVAATGRLSSSDPNLQNIPVRTALGAQIRECFTAEEGNLLVVADYSQIELRIMAELAQEPTLLDAFRNGEDIHTHTAAEVFDVPEDEVDSTHRRYAKAVNFGIMYGISAFGLAQQLGIDREQAGAYIHRYFERMPRVRSFIEATVADARTHGFVATVFGRRRPIPELRSSDFNTRSLGERLAVNSVIQGSAADIIKVAMIRCHRRLAAELSRSAAGACRCTMN